VREGAQHDLALVVGGEVPEELSSEGICRQAGGEDRGDTGQDARRETEQQAIDSAQALLSVGVSRHVTQRA
jgi:hypothetical protein